MIVTDLDGTLFQRDRRISPRNLRTLEELADQRVLRAVATGRNLYSARKVLDAAFPVDYLIFSSGAGIMDWRSQRLLRKISMSRAELLAAFRAVSARRLDFMVHLPIPENHHFLYFPSGKHNPDFEARCALYAEFALPGALAHGAPAAPGGPVAPGRPVALAEACQLLAVEPEGDSDDPSVYAGLVKELPGLRVIRTTSPLDGKSRWLEVFPRRVSKALAAAWVARRAGVGKGSVMAVGNDFNDLDLLSWAPVSFAVRGSPRELTRLFPVADSGPAGESDFAEAVSRWRGRI